MSSYACLSKKLMENLTLDERHILAMRYGLINGDKISSADIGKAYNIDKEKVRRLSDKALKKLGRLVVERLGSI